VTTGEPKDNEGTDAMPVGIASTNQLGQAPERADVLAQLQLRILHEHGGTADGMVHHWNLTPGDSIMHREAAAEIEALRIEVREARALADSEGTRAVKYLRRARQAEAALRELVALKDLKEGPMERSIRASMSIGANPSEQYHQWNEDYQRRKPLAWQTARDVLGPNV